MPLLWRTFRAETDAIYLFAFYILQHHLITAVQTLANLFSFLRYYHSHCQITVLKPHPNSSSWHLSRAYFLRSHSLWVALNIHKCQPVMSGPVHGTAQPTNFRKNTKKRIGPPQSTCILWHLHQNCVGYQRGAHGGSRKHATVPVIIPIRHCFYFLAQSDPANFLSILRLRSSTLINCFIVHLKNDRCLDRDLPPYSIHSK